LGEERTSNGVSGNGGNTDYTDATDGSLSIRDPHRDEPGQPEQQLQQQLPLETPSERY
jgi:hypothetical protein